MHEPSESIYPRGSRPGRRDRRSRIAAGIAIGLAVALAPCARARALPGQAVDPSADAAASRAAVAHSIAITGSAATFDLARLLELACFDSPTLAAARAGWLAARAGIQSASAYPNPSIEVLAGDVRPRRSAGTPSSGSGSEVLLAQPIEQPALRRARIAAAQAGADGAGAVLRLAEADVAAEVRQRFNEVLRARRVQDAAREDLLLAEQILDRVRLRTRAGETPRVDLLRAQTEVAVALRDAEAASARVEQAKAQLRQAVAPTLPATFELAGDIDGAIDPEAIEGLRRSALAESPVLQLSATEIARAERLIDVERGLVLPNVGLRVLTATDPGVRTTLAGVYLNVPLWDRRAGPIAAAQQQRLRARAEADRRRLDLDQAFESSVQAYRAALARVRALDGGILESARAALTITESAYRFGERGILEYLDAQRSFRAVRNDLIAARHDLQTARIEIERLAGRGFDS